MIIVKKKKLIIAALALILVGLVASIIWYKKRDTSPISVYEAMVVVRDQVSSDAADDAKSSLKYGDVLLVSKEGHEWSDTERISYLILRMKLSEKQAERIVAPLDRELTKDEKKAEMDRFREGREVPDEEAERYEEELDQRRETILARAYRIEMEKEFPDFDPNVLLSGQPFADKVFDWGIVEEK